MTSLSIVVAFNLAPHFSPGLLPAVKAPNEFIEQLLLQRGQETLDGRIIPAVFLAAHAAQNAFWIMLSPHWGKFTLCSFMLLENYPDKELRIAHKRAPS